MKYEILKIRQHLEEILQKQGQFSQEESHEIAFHLTDWHDDLKKLVEYFENPTLAEPNQLLEMLYAFLIHVPNHVAAASKLMTGIGVKDIFEVGALEKESNESA